MYMVIIYRSFANVGYRPWIKSQRLEIDPAFDNYSDIIHELFHVLGRYHEQERKDRDKYVTIHLENIGTHERSELLNIFVIIELYH